VWAQFQTLDLLALRPLAAFLCDLCGERLLTAKCAEEGQRTQSIAKLISTFRYFFDF
jgi:hypothetical protein